MEGVDGVPAVDVGMLQVGYQHFVGDFRRKGFSVYVFDVVDVVDFDFGVVVGE